MAKSLQKLAARRLRKEGKGIRYIARTVGISRGTVSVWCNDIILTDEQIKKLMDAKSEALRLNQLRGSSSNRNKKLAKIETYKKEGLARFLNLTDQEFFMAGLALYLAEGRKTQKTVFTNSDPKIIKFIMLWFQKYFDILPDRFSYYIYINESHRDRADTVKNFWAGYLRAPLGQFRNVTFIKSKLQKVYEN